MMEEISASHANVTWELMSLPHGKTTVECHWVYTVKISPSEKIDRLKARLLPKAMLRFLG